METIQPKIVKNLVGTDLISNYFVPATDKLKLFQNDITPGPNTVLADLTEATFTGYAAVVPLTAWARGIDAQNREQLTEQSGLARFLQTANTVTNIVYGWYLVDTAGTILKLVKRLDTPVTFDAAGVELFLKLLMFLEINAGSDEEVTT